MTDIPNIDDFGGSPGAASNHVALAAAWAAHDVVTMSPGVYNFTSPVAVSGNNKQLLAPASAVNIDIPGGNWWQVPYAGLYSARVELKQLTNSEGSSTVVTTAGVVRNLEWVVRQIYNHSLTGGLFTATGAAVDEGAYYDCHMYIPFYDPRDGETEVASKPIIDISLARAAFIGNHIHTGFCYSGNTHPQFRIENSGSGGYNMANQFYLGENERADHGVLFMSGSAGNEITVLGFDNTTWQDHMVRLYSSGGLGNIGNDITVNAGTGTPGNYCHVSLESATNTTVRGKSKSAATALRVNNIGGQGTVIDGDFVNAPVVINNSRYPALSATTMVQSRFPRSAA